MENTKEDFWTENGGFVRCWMTGNKRELIVKSIILMKEGYFCILSPRKYKNIGTLHILRASKIASLLVPPLVIERNQTKALKEKQNYRLDKTLILDPAEDKWKAETRLWITEEERNLETNTPKGIRFLSAMYSGTFTH